MAVGILLAGGVGKRMGANVPKQFLIVNGKPIIYYPLTEMENHPEITDVEIVCVESFIDEMWKIVKEFGFRKVKWIVPGGATCQDSTYNGLKNLRDKVSENEIVLIHMSSYPLVDQKIMTDCIGSAKQNGNGCAARPVVYSAFQTDDQKTSTKMLDRTQIRLCTIPYAFRFDECIALYDQAFQEQKYMTENIFTNTLYALNGKTIYFTKDSDINMKVTTPEDIGLMEAILNRKN